MVCNCSVGPYFVYNRSLQKAVKVWLYGRIHYVTNPPIQSVFESMSKGKSFVVFLIHPPFFTYQYSCLY